MSNANKIVTCLQIDPEWTAEKELRKRRGEAYIPPAKKVDDEDFQSEAASNLRVGQRCEVYPGGKRGQIRFVTLLCTNNPDTYKQSQVDQRVMRAITSLPFKRQRHKSFSCDAYELYKFSIFVHLAKW